MIVTSVLAAGASRRLGRPKQLVRFRGATLVERALSAAYDLERVSVVLGAYGAEVASVIDDSVVVLTNDAWAEGVASSLRLAATWAASVDAAALVILVTDQPLIDRAHVIQLARRWQYGATAAASAYAGVIGVPAIFDASLFGELRALTGDRGAARILRARSDVAIIPWEEGALDIDTPEALAALG